MANDRRQELHGAIRKLLQAHSREHLARVLHRYSESGDTASALLAAHTITEASIEELVDLLFTHTSRG